MRELAFFLAQGYLSHIPLGCPFPGLRGVSQPIEPDPAHTGVGNGDHARQDRAPSVPLRWLQT